MFFSLCSAHAERFLEAIDKNYMCRSIGQREFHRAFTIACLPHIVGEGEWEKHRATFLKHFMEDEFKGEVLVTTPRRALSSPLSLALKAQTDAPRCLPPPFRFRIWEDDGRRHVRERPPRLL